LRPPHRFPFELVDREVDGGGRFAATTAAWWLRGSSELTLPWIVEAAAQAAARVLGEPGTAPRRMALAGVDAARLDRALIAGEICELRVRLAGRWGHLVKVEAEVEAGGAAIGKLDLLLAALPEAAIAETD
jgi:3-hydroxymyristoyl/3-hydroxydecanoyl-(acyl carrier protein) dehydratase